MNESNAGLRDHFAGLAMQANVAVWSSELSSEYRVKLLEGMMKRFGDLKTYDAIAKMSYEMADAMMRAREATE